jgi:hypothetical protein
MDGERTIKIIKDISQLINASGGDCSEWRIGVATNLEREQFGREISRDDTVSLYRCAVSAEEARAIVRGFMNLSCEGNIDDRSEVNGAAVFIYVYRKPRKQQPAAENKGAQAPDSPRRPRA